jgi:hypothetical protein
VIFARDLLGRIDGDWIAGMPGGTSVLPEFTSHCSLAALTCVAPMSLPRAHCRGLDGDPESVYRGPDLPFLRVRVVTPLRAKNIRVRIDGRLRDDVDVRLLAELLLEVRAETEREQLKPPEEPAGLTDSERRRAETQ